MEDKNFSVNDLLLNDSFVRWIKDPDESLNAYWNEWIAINSDKREAFTEAKRIIKLLKEENAGLSEKRVLAMKQHIDFSINNQFKKSKGELIKKVSTTFYYKAVAVLVFTFFSLGLIYFFISDRNNILSGQEVEFVNHKGVPQKKVLQDGTIVWLNGESKLRFPKKFADSVREVYLEGEGYFNVKKEPHHPFIVHTSQLDIKVYGTSFNVKAYQGDELIQTTLIEGKVAVTEINGDKDSKETVLKPKDQATFSKSNKSLSIKKVDAEYYSSWKHNQLIFKSTEVKDVVRTLQRRFDIDIEVADTSINNCRITGDFTGQPLPIVLELFSKSIEAKITREGNKITIKGKGCNN